MITQREIAFWRTIAPWSNDLMVEQDYLLGRAVEAIFSDPYLRRNVAMRGGTVLHKAHLAPPMRYSEDIDLVLVTEAKQGNIKSALARALKPLLGHPTESAFTQIQLAVRNFLAKSTILRTTYTYDPYSDEAAHSHLKVEVNTNETKSFYPLVEIELEVPDGVESSKRISVVSYDLDEMLGTKLRALLQRDHGRDLYDLWWAWRVSERGTSATKVDPARVGAAFRFYMTNEDSTFSASSVEQELSRRLKSKKFLRDMDNYLRVGQTYSAEEACEEFCAVFLPHLDAPA